MQRQLLLLQAEPELIVVEARDGAVMIEHAEALAGRAGLIPHGVGSVISGKAAGKKEGEKIALSFGVIASWSPQSHQSVSADSRVAALINALSRATIAAP